MKGYNEKPMDSSSDISISERVFSKDVSTSKTNGTPSTTSVEKQTVDIISSTGGETHYKINDETNTCDIFSSVDGNTSHVKESETSSTREVKQIGRNYTSEGESSSNRIYNGKPHVERQTPRRGTRFPSEAEIKLSQKRIKKRDLLRLTLLPMMHR